MRGGASFQVYIKDLDVIETREAPEFATISEFLKNGVFGVFPGKIGLPKNKFEEYLRWLFSGCLSAKAGVSDIQMFSFEVSQQGIRWWCGKTFKDLLPGAKKIPLRVKAGRPSIVKGTK